MKNWRKWILFSLLAMMFLTAGAAACEGEHPIGMEGVCVAVEPETSEQVRLMGADLEAAEAALIEGMLQMKARISVRNFGLSTDDLVSLMNRIVYEDPELFMLDRGYGYVLGGGGLVTEVVPQYTMSRAEYTDAQVIYRAEVQAIAGMVNQEWSAVEKVLFVHDYLASHYEYDTSLEIHDAYRFFVQGKGVCESYTLAGIAVLRELGIEVSYVSSRALNHAWNLVKVDGEWYHMDITHDDPLYNKLDLMGYAGHKNFLLSREAIMERKNSAGNDWVCGVNAATGNRYDGYFWEEAISPFVYAEQDGVWYYADSNGLRSWSGEGEATRSVEVFEPVRIEMGNSIMIWQDTPNSVGLSLSGNKLYYNSCFCIKTYDLEKQQGTVLKALDPREERMILGAQTDGRTLNYQIYAYTIGRASVETMDVREFVSVGAHCSYFRNGDQLELRLNDGSLAYLAVYGENGAMLRSICCKSSGSYEISGEKVCLFVLDSTSWIPLSRAVVL